MSAYNADSTFQERLNMKDPATASSRIFVGSIPHENVVRQDIEDCFSKFGKVTGKESKSSFLLNSASSFCVHHFISKIFPFLTPCFSPLFRCVIKPWLWICSV